MADLSGVKFAVITVSDTVSAGERKDESGPEAIRLIESSGGIVTGSEAVPDEQSQIEERIRWWVREPSVDVVMTTGGTGVAPRDVTPEATEKVCDRLVPGLAELMRRVSLEKTPHAALSRGLAGIAEETLIVNLPGSTGGVRDCFEALAPVLGHAVHLIRNEATRHLQT